MQRDTHVEPLAGKDILWFDVFIGGTIDVKTIRNIAMGLEPLGKFSHEDSKGFEAQRSDIELFGGPRGIFIGNWFRRMAAAEQRFILSDIFELKKSVEGADLDSLSAYLLVEEICFDMPLIVRERDAGSEAGVRYMRRYRPNTTRLVQYPVDNLDRPVVRADELHRRFRDMIDSHFIFGGDDPMTEAKLEAALDDLRDDLVPPANELDMNTLRPVRLIGDAHD